MVETMRKRREGQLHLATWCEAWPVTRTLVRPSSVQRAWHFIIPKANEPPGAEGCAAQKGRQCDDGRKGFTFWLFPCRRARGRQAQPTLVRRHASRVIQGRHAPRECAVVAAHDALGLVAAASLPPPHGEARNVAAPPIGTPLPRSRMMVLGRAAKVKGHGELAGPGKGYSRVAATCMSVCLPSRRGRQAANHRAQLSCCVFSCAVAALRCAVLLLVLLGPSHHGPSLPHVI